MAANFLYRRYGFRLLTKNYEVEQGEVDLIFRHQNMLVFVEVRTRTFEQTVSALETIDSVKQNRLEQAARAYLAELDNRETPHRFAAVSVTWRPSTIPVCTLLEMLE